MHRTVLLCMRMRVLLVDSLLDSQIVLQIDSQIDSLLDSQTVLQIIIYIAHTNIGTDTERKKSKGKRASHMILHVLITSSYGENN